MSAVCRSARSSVLPTSYSQITHTQRLGILTSALTYTQAVTADKKNFRSSSALLAYRTGQLLAGSTNGPGPAQTVIITNLQAFGC